MIGLTTCDGEAITIDARSILFVIQKKQTQIAVGQYIIEVKESLEEVLTRLVYCRGY